VTQDLASAGRSIGVAVGAMCRHETLPELRARATIGAWPHGNSGTLPQWGDELVQVWGHVAAWDSGPAESWSHHECRAAWQLWAPKQGGELVWVEGHMVAGDLAPAEN
jgi:hypothetical protein